MHSLTTVDTSRVALLLLGVAVVLTFWRLLRGPSTPDRLVALDLIGLEAIGMIVVVATAGGSKYLIDVALVVAVLTFLGTVVMARYVLRR